MSLTDAEEIDIARAELFARNQAANRLRNRVLGMISFPAPTDLWVEYELTGQMLHRTVVDLVSLSRVGDRVETAEGTMIVAEKRPMWDGQAAHMVLTRDGLPREKEWHEGPESSNCIRAEVYSSDGLIFHGYVDSVSRKIVQTG